MDEWLSTGVQHHGDGNGRMSFVREGGHLSMHVGDEAGADETNWSC